jgi:hypothetical protein
MLLIPNLQQGGAEKQILELARNLPARFAPVLCLWNDTIHYRDLLPAGQPRHVLGVQRLGRKGLRRLQEILREEKPSILHSYRDKANFLARLALPRAPVPVVLTSVRNRAINLLYLLTERYLSRRSDRVLVNSQAVRYELRRWARVPDSKIQIIRPRRKNVRQHGHDSIWRATSWRCCFPGGSAYRKTTCGWCVRWRG